jgi:hypothetical protein
LTPNLQSPCPTMSDAVDSLGIVSVQDLQEFNA